MTRCARAESRLPRPPLARCPAAATTAPPPRKDLQGRVWFWPQFGAAVASIHLLLVWPHVSSLFSLHACACAVFPTKILFPLPCLTHLSSLQETPLPAFADLHPFICWFMHLFLSHQLIEQELHAIHCPECWVHKHEKGMVHLPCPAGTSHP